ncbi:MAG: tetratricopeptide repeat protein [Puniceicoccales bacterium]|jgi:type III secretion system low calcium response chaperone LcrH/SycD|nr:tetratricopeptide repeat protein [Puniceicoccales bacterium]
MTDISVAEKIKEELVSVMGSKAENVDPEMIQLSLDVGKKLATGEMRLADAFNIPKDKLNVMYAIAYDLYSNDKYEKALGIFNMLCIYDPLNVDYWQGVGATYKMLKQYELAAAAYGTLVKLRSTQMSYYLDLAECFLQLKQVENAKNCLEGVILMGEADNLKNRGNNCEAHVQRAKALLALLEKKSK